VIVTGRVTKKQRRFSRTPPKDVTSSAGHDDETDALSELGCPDCRGVLRVRSERGLLSFRCRVGHAFSGETLLPMKEDMLETALWTAVELYEEIVILHRDLGDRARASKRASLAIAFERRARLAMSQAKKVRAILVTDRPARIDDLPARKR
jgi:two-component system, chemotaxis family, protein-glutamate methylesterase/glutaminase